MKWKILTVSGMEWFAITSGTSLTLLLAYVFFFVGSARRDAEQQMLILEILLVVFAVSTAYLLYFACMVTIRWNEWQLEQDSLVFGKRAIRFADICQLLPLMWANVLRINSSDGTRIYVPLYRNGAAAFIEKLTTKLELNNENGGVAEPGE